METVDKYLSFDPDTGAFAWRMAKRDRPAGAIAGYVDSEGGVVITMAGIACNAHDLAWLCTHGAWPKRMVEHVNGDRADNRPGNLQLRAPP